MKYEEFVKANSGSELVYQLENLIVYKRKRESMFKGQTKISIAPVEVEGLENDIDLLPPEWLCGYVALEGIQLDNFKHLIDDVKLPGRDPYNLDYDGYCILGFDTSSWNDLEHPKDLKKVMIECLKLYGVAVAALNQLYGEKKENPKLIETVEQHKQNLSEILRDFENHKFSPPLL